MRALGLPIVLLAACSFRTVPGAGGDDTVTDGAIDGTPDSMIDGAPITAFRKRLTIDSARVTGAQTEFPVWIALDDNDLKARATDTGADIYFTGTNGTALPYQIQRWVKSTGRLEAWVRVDLADATDTMLELRYGEPSRASAPSPQTVFSSSFAAVWHLEDSLSTSAVVDARGLRDGATAGGLGTADQVAAQLGGGVDFDGNNDRITFTNPFTGGGAHTFSAWVNQRTSTSCDTIVTVGTATTNHSRWFHSHYVPPSPNTPGVGVGFYGNDWPSIADVDNAGWVLLHWVFEGASLMSRVYRNGTQVGSFTFNGGVDTQGTEGYIGYAPNGWGLCALNGTLDEVRLATIDRDAGWIATEYANQSSPQTFYTVGPEQPAP